PGGSLIWRLFHPVGGSVSYPDSSPSLWKKTSCDRLSRLIFRTSVSTAFRTLLREEVLVHFTFCQHLKSIFLAVVLGLICMGVLSPATAGTSSTPLLLRKPTVSRTQIAFSYGGDLWIVDRNGGEARHLTSDVGIETDPFFSPDGSMIAFTGEYDGNEDVRSEERRVGEGGRSGRSAKEL